MKRWIQKLPKTFKRSYSTQPLQDFEPLLIQINKGTQARTKLINMIDFGKMSGQILRESKELKEYVVETARYNCEESYCGNAWKIYQEILEVGEEELLNDRDWKNMFRLSLMDKELKYYVKILKELHENGVSGEYVLRMMSLTPYEHENRHEMLYRFKEIYVNKVYTSEYLIMDLEAGRLVFARLLYAHRLWPKDIEKVIECAKLLKGKGILYLDGYLAQRHALWDIYRLLKAQQEGYDGHPSLYAS